MTTLTCHCDVALSCACSPREYALVMQRHAHHHSSCGAHMLRTSAENALLACLHALHGLQPYSSAEARYLHQSTENHPATQYLAYCMGLGPQSLHQTLKAVAAHALCTTLHTPHTSYKDSQHTPSRAIWQASTHFPITPHKDS